MCLPIAVKYPDRVLSKGVHAGHEFVVANNGRGYRCGYIQVPAGHPWHGKNYNDIDCKVHGGLTFSARDVPSGPCTCVTERDTHPVLQHSVLCPQYGKDAGFWLGFDCAHCYDLPDLDLPSDTPVLTREMFDLGLKSDAYMAAAVRTQEYVEVQCRSLCEQAAAAASPATEDVA